MRLPEFTAQASLGKTSEHYVLTSEYPAGASTRSLQPQFYARFGRPACTLAFIDCFLFDQCYYYNQNCLPPSPSPPSGGGGGGNGGGGSSPGPGSTHVVAGI
jgi:hypothetical protein